VTYELLRTTPVGLTVDFSTCEQIMTYYKSSGPVYSVITVQAAGRDGLRLQGAGPVQSLDTNRSQPLS